MTDAMQPLDLNDSSNFPSSNPNSLKGKLGTIENLIKAINEDITGHKKEVQMLKSEKDTLQSVLTMKTSDVKEALNEELKTLDSEMRRHFAHQKAENSRLQQQITVLRGEKTSLQQQLIGLQRRIGELEMQIGTEETE